MRARRIGSIWPSGSNPQGRVVVSGLYVVFGAATTKLALYKYDGTTQTLLAAETGNSFTLSTLHRLDLQLVSYGASATVNVCFNGILVITFSGGTTVSGVTDLDSIFIQQGRTLSATVTG